jgi:cytochrome c oxidase subunit 2
LARPRLRLLVPVAAALTLLAVAAPVEASVLGPRAAHSPNADAIRTTYWVLLVIAVLLVVAVNVALFTAVARFRDQRGREPSRFTAGRGVFARAAAPLVLIVAGIFVFGVVKTSDVRDVQISSTLSSQASTALTAQVGIANLPPSAALQSQDTSGEQPVTSAGGPSTAPLEINAVGQLWLWRFEYPNVATPGPPFDAFSYNELVVPVGTTVVLDVTSTDVIHRWFVPALGGQVDAVPGQVSQTWFRADQIGTYPGQSTSFSGSAYSAMRIWVKVVSPEAYTRFLDRKRAQIKASQGLIQNLIEHQATVGGVKLP